MWYRWLLVSNSGCCLRYSIFNNIARNGWCSGYDNKVYVFGGKIQSGDDQIRTNTIEICDLIEYNCVLLDQTVLPLDMSEMRTLLVNDLIFIIGGSLADDERTEQIQIIDPVYHTTNEIRVFANVSDSIISQTKNGNGSII